MCAPKKCRICGIPRPGCQLENGVCVICKDNKSTTPPPVIPNTPPNV